MLGLEGINLIDRSGLPHHLRDELSPKGEKEMKKLRLIIFKECNKSCIGCCNKDWDLKNLPIETDFSQYDEILLTGGEPMLVPLSIIRTIKRIRHANKTAKIYLYTAKTYPPLDLLSVLNFLDGITVTLHEQWDVEEFRFFNNIITGSEITKSFRLNIFKGIDIKNLNLSKWIIKNNMTWIKNCPLPKGEVLKRLDEKLI
uniref:Putative iron-sulfur binding domain containing protein n=1 Tax=viral metagenome TaxID=1070528 RepID=A0A6H2A3H0_9ZZZZ